MTTSKVVWSEELVLDCWFWCTMFEHMLHIEYDAVVDYANSSSNQWLCCWHSLSFSVHCTYVFLSMFPGHNPLAMCTEELIVFCFLLSVPLGLGMQQQNRFSTSMNNADSISRSTSASKHHFAFTLHILRDVLFYLNCVMLPFFYVFW